MREQTKWAQRCANNVTPGRRDRNALSLSNTLEKKQDAARLASIRAYGRACCYPNLTERPTWLDSFLKAFRPYLVGLARHLLVVQYYQDAEDIVHTVILRVLSKPTGTELREHEGDAGRFLIQALKWEILNRYVVVNRELSRTSFIEQQPIIDEDEPDWERQEDAGMPTTPCPEGRYIAAIAIRKALDRLTPTQSLVLDAYHLQGYTAPEIATMRDRCLATIKDLISRGTAKFTVVLAD